MKNNILKTMRSWLPKKPKVKKCDKQETVVSTTATAKMYDEWIR